MVSTRQLSSFIDNIDNKRVLNRTYYEHFWAELIMNSFLNRTELNIFEQNLLWTEQILLFLLVNWKLVFLTILF